MSDEQPARSTEQPDPARVVADADVLAADLLTGGAPRDALDVVRRHSWVDLVASDPLLDDAEAIVAELASPDVAADWRDRIDAERVRVEHPEGDHPALASALHGSAAHVLTFDEGLTSTAAGLGLQGRVSVSVRTPSAFLQVFDAPGLYELTVGGDYPGPDRDPRV